MIKFLTKLCGNLLICKVLHDLGIKHNYNVFAISIFAVLCCFAFMIAFELSLHEDKKEDEK